MAVGKVGSFATVQPAIVDFGGMAQGAFDKMKADEERKRREKEARDEKRRQEIEKLGGLGFLKSTNVKGFNQGLESIYTNMRREYADAKASSNTTKMRELQEEVFSMNNIVDNVVKQHDFYLKNQDKFDPDYFNRATSVLENIDIANMDVKRGEDGRVRFTVYGDPERKEVLFRDMTPNEIVDSLKIPYKFDSEAMVKGFVKNYALDDVERMINSGGIIGTAKDIKLEDNPRVLSAIESKANELVNDSKAMAWFGKQIGKYESDAMGYSTEEKKQAKEEFTKKLKEAYKSEYDLAIQQKRTGRGGGDKKINLGSVTTIPMTFVEGDDKTKTTSKRDVLSVSIGFGDGSRTRGISYGNTVLGSIMYDPKSNSLYFGTVTSGSEGISVGGKGAGNQNINTKDNVSVGVPENIKYENLPAYIQSDIQDAVGARNKQELIEKIFGNLRGGNQATTQGTTSGGNVR